MTGGTDGQVTLTMTATDKAANERTGSNDVTLDLDTTGPTASNYDPVDGATVTTKQPTLGVDLSDTQSDVDGLTILVTVNNTDGSKTYLNGVSTSKAGVNWDDSTGHLTVNLTEAGITLDEKQVTVKVSVDDADANTATYAWSFTVDVPETSDDSDRDGDNPYSSYSTEEPSETTTESSDSTTDDSDDASDQSTPSATETSDDVTTAESTGTSAASPTESSDADDKTTHTGVPGFGVVVALVAPLAAALLARREA